ncbi:hypothetical protein GCM10027348_12940 [Hymenobacter tenuis]
MFYISDIRFSNCTYALEHASYALTYFEAPVLSNYYLDAEIIRFLWLRSFHRPVLLTLRHTKGGSTLQTQLLDKHPGFTTYTIHHPDSLPSTSSAEEREEAWRFYREMMADPTFQKQVAKGKRRAKQVNSEETTVAVRPEQWYHLQVLLAQTQFPTMSSCQPRPGMLDGSEWLLESHQADSYHMVLRRSPENEDGFRSACEYLIELSSVRNEERY